MTGAHRQYKPGFEPTPCERFNCPNVAKCRHGRACDSFARFVETGFSHKPPGTPTEEQYRVLFPTEEA